MTVEYRLLKSSGIVIVVRVTVNYRYQIEIRSNGASFVDVWFWKLYEIVDDVL